MYVGRAKTAQFLRLAIHVLLKHDDLARFDPIFIKSLLAHQITVERQLADVVHAADVIILAPVPKDLPFYNIGGDQDPVGEYGKGIYEVSNWLCDTGHDVKTRVYSGYRHEIHNYSEIKNDVEEGIIAFMDGILGI